MITRRCVSKRRGAKVSAALTAAALSLALPQGRALAADWPQESLRGSFTTEAPVRWDGINFGGHFGLSTMDTDFGGGTGQQVAYILRESTLEQEARPSSWAALPHNITNSRSYGAFIGYSYQMQDIVLGFDAAYNRMSSANADASDTLTRGVTTSDGVGHIVTIDARSSVKLVDYATMRVRAGYVMGQFLPYAFVGGAVGRFNYSTRSTVTSAETPPAPALPYVYGPITATDAKDNAIVGGVAAGLGMDIALLPNLFLRGEWEYVGFARVNGIRTSINTGRVGLGMRF
ncbi:MAG: outer membrane beta-barrel protein [Pseudolabrys sp.]|nr:outer membrane beta-barrel protein [Pseudolabrys sp.]